MLKRFRQTSRALLKPETFVAIGAVSGWSLLTLFLAVMLTPWIWALSGGLFLLSLVGWKLLGRLALDGFYVLAQEEPQDEEERPPVRRPPLQQLNRQTRER